MPPRKKVTTAAPAPEPVPEVIERVRVQTPEPPPPPPPVQQQVDYNQPAAVIFDQLISSMSAGANISNYGGTYGGGPYGAYEDDYIPRQEIPREINRDPPREIPRENNREIPRENRETPRDFGRGGGKEEAPQNVGNAYTNNSNPFPYAAYAVPSAPPKSTPFTPARRVDPRFDRSRQRSRSPPRHRSRSPPRQRSRSPPRNRRSLSPSNRNRRKAPPIPTAVALDLLSWIPAHIWREHGYQPPIKL